MDTRPSATAAGREPFRPFFWVDGQFRIRGWPDATARALRRSADAVIGRHCWEVAASGPRARSGGQCRFCVGVQGPGCGQKVDARQASVGCAVLPLPGPNREAIVWLPLSRLAVGTTGSAQLEGLVMRGALAGWLDSVEGMLDGLRRACAADDCELFLVDASGTEVFLVDCEGIDRDAFLQQTRMALGTGYPGTVTQSQRPRFTNRIQRDRLFLRTEVKRRGISSYLGVPLLHAGRPLGYLGLGWRAADVPMEWGLQVVEHVKSLVPLALRGRGSPLPAVEPASAGLAIRCFGPFEIFRSGRHLPPENFGRRKALELLKILVLQHGAPVHRDRLTELLWPGVEARSGTNRLHGVVNALRSTIEAGRHSRTSEYVVCRGDHYFFNTAVPHSVDMYDFLELITAACNAQRQGAEDHAATLFENAIGLYRGDLFADDAGNEAFEGYRVRLRHSYLDAVRTVAAGKIRRDRTDDAVRLLRTALAFESVAIDLQEMLISQLARLGRLAEARQQYESCRTALRHQLDMEPPERTRALEQLFH